MFLQQRFFVFFIIVAFFALSCGGKKENNYISLIEKGEFSKATRVINELLQTGNHFTPTEKKQMLFEIERMQRIRKDFTKSEQEVLDYIKTYIPNVTKEDLAKWEQEKSLEYKIIDGDKKYFNRAGRNLFRINKECRKIWQDYQVKKQGAPKTSPEEINLEKHNREIMKQVTRSGQKYVSPVRFRIHYSISVHENTVPAGETVKCWIPFPREIPERQVDIILLKSDPADYTLADPRALQRTIYFEKPAVKDQKTVFSVNYEFTNHGTYVNIETAKVQPVTVTNALKPYLEERPPHIVFTDELRQLSRKIVGDETNPYRIAQKLFAWEDENIPWASAREYSTIKNISRYACENKHGDCGIQTLLFMTLCRMNGIPTRWQSGWEFKPPGSDSMHDWGMIYFEPYGWMPMDMTYGLRKTDDEKYKWFYLSGMDSYRLIFNDDYAQPFQPQKQHFRSEIVDSQRGEVEWKGGNLYFDKWDWEMKWEVVKE